MYQKENGCEVGGVGWNQITWFICLEKVNRRRALQLWTEGITKVQIKGGGTSSVLLVSGTLCGEETGGAAQTSD